MNKKHVYIVEYSLNEYQDVFAIVVAENPAEAEDLAYENSCLTERVEMIVTEISTNNSSHYVTRFIE